MQDVVLGHRDRLAALAQDLLRLVQAHLLGEQLGESDERADPLVLDVLHVGRAGEGGESQTQFGLGLVVAAQGLERTGQAPAQGALHLIAGRSGRR